MCTEPFWLRLSPRTACFTWIWSENLSSNYSFYTVPPNNRGMSHPGNSRVLHQVRTSRVWVQQGNSRVQDWKQNIGDWVWGGKSRVHGQVRKSGDWVHWKNSRVHHPIKSHLVLCPQERIICSSVCIGSVSIQGPISQTDLIIKTGSARGTKSRLCAGESPRNYNVITAHSETRLRFELNYWKNENKTCAEDQKIACAHSNTISFTSKN